MAMTRAQHRYFISHAPSDQSQAIQLYTELQAQGIPPRCLSDPLTVDSHHIPPDRFNSRKEFVLESCSAMIVLLSRAAIEEGPTLSDVSYALEAYETIILVKMEPCTLPYYLLRLKTLSRIQSFSVDLTREGELDFTPLVDIIRILEPSQSFDQPSTGFSSPPLSSPPPPFPSLPLPPRSYADKPTIIAVPVLDPVNLGVATPPSVSSGEAFVARFVAYTDSERLTVMGALQREAPLAQHRLDLDRCQWKFGTKVTVRLEARGATVERPHQTFVWKSSSESLRFDVEVAANTPLNALILKFDIAVEGLPIMSLRPEIEIKQVAVNPTLQPPQIIRQAFPKSAFASYTRLDRKEVLGRLRSLQISTGMDVFVDCLSLRPGEKWKPKLNDEIVTRDVFLLFWSSRAMASKWVEWEWKTALREKSIEAIQPHPLEPVDIAPPPPELSELQFGNIYEWYLSQLRVSWLPSRKRVLLMQNYGKNMVKSVLTSLIVLFLLSVVFSLVQLLLN